MRRLMYLALGDQARYGLPRPAHPIWREHATLSQELLPYIGHGWIRVKPDIRELRPDAVVFTDGTEEPVDAIIHATGYKTTFPFIDPALFAVKDQTVALYRRMLPPELPGLFMVGLVQPVGPTIPLVEIQSRWLAAVLAGDVSLPDIGIMQEEIRRHERELARRYIGSARYTLEVDYSDYARRLHADMRHGAAGA